MMRQDVQAQGLSLLDIDSSISKERVADMVERHFAACLASQENQGNPS